MSLLGIGLVVNIFSCISFSNVWVDTYLFTYEANWVGKFHSFSIFSGSNSNLQYLDIVPSSDWLDCFLLPPLDWIPNGLLVWFPLWQSLDWISVGSLILFPWTCGSTGFCVGLLVLLRIIEENIICGFYSKCLYPAPEFTVRKIYSHPEPEVPGEYFWKYCFQTFKKLFS